MEKAATCELCHCLPRGFSQAKLPRQEVMTLGKETNTFSSHLRMAIDS